MCEGERTSEKASKRQKIRVCVLKSVYVREREREKERKRERERQGERERERETGTRETEREREREREKERGEPASKTANKGQRDRESLREKGNPGEGMRESRTQFEHIELRAKLLDYFLRSNKNIINNILTSPLGALSKAHHMPLWHLPAHWTELTRSFDQLSL